MIDFICADILEKLYNAAIKQLILYKHACNINKDLRRL